MAIPVEKTCDRLNTIAEEYRARMIIRNNYNSVNDGAQYSATHPNATQAQNSRDPLNIKGKNPIGGGQFDTSNGGGYYDIEARKKINFENQYTPDKKYDCFPNNIVISLSDLGG